MICDLLNFQAVFVLIIPTLSLVVCPVYDGGGGESLGQLFKQKYGVATKNRKDAGEPINN